MIDSDMCKRKCKDFKARKTCTTCKFRCDDEEKKLNLANGAGCRKWRLRELSTWGGYRKHNSICSEDETKKGNRSE